MARFDYDLVCIGSGPAGQRAAVQAAKLGRRVAVIERKRIIGGVSVDTGTIPSKTFREAVMTLVNLQGRFDRRKSGRSGHVSARELLGRVVEVIRRESEVVEDQLGRNAVEMIRGQAAFVDPHTLEVDSAEGSRRLSAANILIAVGTRPAVPPGIAIDGRVVITSDGVVDLERLPRKMVVVGGGVIGVEYAPMFAALGIEVTLIDRQARLLDFLDNEIVDELTRQMAASGVAFRLGEDLERIELLPGGQAEIRLVSGARIEADLVMITVGRIGCTDRLNLEAAGLEADLRGRLRVDATMRTAVPHIFAAGDVIGYPSLAATSSEQGRLAACHAFGIQACPMSPHFPIGIYSIPEISMVGEPEHALRSAGVAYEVGLARYREIARGQILGDDSGLFKMLFDKASRALLGVHIIGTGATELIHIGQAVMSLGGGLDYFLTTVFNYPTLAECYKVAALDASNKMNP